MKTYESYKDSGVEWIGEIPSHWDVSKVKHSGLFINGYPFKPEDWSDLGRPIIRIQTLTGTNTDTNKYEGELDEKYLIRRGDLLFSWSTTLGMYLWDNEDGWLNQHIFKVVPKVIYNREFYRYMFSPLTMFLTSRSHGSTMTHLTKENFGGNDIPLPPLPEQEQIVSFLDEKTSKIDDLIKKKEQKIELLKEYRTSLINRVITKGLNPDVPMKDSGVEWIGEIPSHWDVKKLKRSTMVKRGSSPRPIDDPKYFDDNGYYSWVRISDVSSSNRYLETTEQRLSELGSSFSTPINPGQLFLSIAGSVGKPIISRIHCCIHDGFVWFDGFNENTDYLYYIFITGTCFSGLGKMGTQLNLNTDTVGMIDVPTPPLPEQEQIVSYVDHKTGEIDSTISSEKKKIELLKEYRQSLISSVITGKIKVVD